MELILQYWLFFEKKRDFICSKLYVLSLAVIDIMLTLQWRKWWALSDEIYDWVLFKQEKAEVWNLYIALSLLFNVAHLKN